MVHDTKTTLFGLLAFALYLIYTSNGFCINRSWHVHIINGIASSSIVINPKSGNDDLGIQILQPNQAFTWHFCEKTAGSTIFNSTFFWNPRLANFTVFNDEYRYECIKERGVEDCYWLVREDGFYLSPYENPFPQDWVKKHDWP